MKLSGVLLTAAYPTAAQPLCPECRNEAEPKETNRSDDNGQQGDQGLNENSVQILAL